MLCVWGRIQTVKGLLPWRHDSRSSGGGAEIKKNKERNKNAGRLELNGMSLSELCVRGG